MSAAEAALVPVRPQAAPLPRYRLLPAKTVPERHATLVALKLVLSKARKTATVPASALPNAAVDARVVTPVKMEAVKKTIPTVTPVPAGTRVVQIVPMLQPHPVPVPVVQ